MKIARVGFNVLLDTLFDRETRAWRFTPSLALPIFNGGRLTLGKGTIVTDNHAWVQGGGVANSDGATVIIRSTGRISSNQADERAGGLVENFAAQWLSLRNVRQADPDENRFPEFDFELKQAFDLTYLFIGHDLAVVEHVSDYILVMSKGQIVERGTPDEILHHPQHPYTQTLLAAVPKF